MILWHTTFLNDSCFFLILKKTWSAWKADENRSEDLFVLILVALKKAASFLVVKIRSYLVMMHMKMMFSCCSTCILSIFPTQFSSTKRSKSDLYATLQLLLNSGNPSHQSPNWWWRLIIHRLCSINVVKIQEKHLITPKIRASCKNLWNVNKSYLIGIKVCVSLSLKHLFHTIVSFLGLARPFFTRGSLKECRL